MINKLKEVHKLSSLSLIYRVNFNFDFNLTYGFDFYFIILLFLTSILSSSQCSKNVQKSSFHLLSKSEILLICPTLVWDGTCLP